MVHLYIVCGSCINTHLEADDLIGEQIELSAQRCQLNELTQLIGKAVVDDLSKQCSKEYDELYTE